MKVFGFALLRNGVKYDYPFRESLLSLSKITEKIYLALGESEDGTEKAVSGLPFLKIIPTRWDESLREGGLILSQQTNVALEALKNDCNALSLKDQWGIYLQCDEVIHENDYEKILEDLRFANQNGYDAVRFRYLHFWQDHHHVAINKKWYPCEIRAIKLDSPAESWGDAQSFQNVKKVFDSDAYIYHYGHVRERDAYKNKKRDILKLYHLDHRIKKYRRREIRYDNKTECLSFFGSHPLVMKDRIERLGDVWVLPAKEKVGIIGDLQQLDQIKENFSKKINAHEVFYATTLSELPSLLKENIVLLKPKFWQKFWFQTFVPNGMRSKLAKPWDFKMFLTLKLSEKKISLLA